MSNRRAYILAGAFFVCAAGLAYQYSEIRALRLEVSENRAAVERAAIDVALALAKSEDLDSRINALAKSAGLKFNAIAPPSRRQLDVLQPGIYELKTDTRYDPDSEETSKYTITHVVVQLGYDSYQMKLSIGVATSSMMYPKGVYFDYNNDGQVDTDMAMKFVRELPFGNSLAKAYDPDEAQNLYSIFVGEVDNAEYTSTDDLANGADAKSSYLWTFVESQYETIKAWVFENLPDQPSDD